MSVDRRIFAQFDWILFGLTLLIPTLGLGVLYSAGFDPDSSHLLSDTFLGFIESPAFARQSVFFIAGIVALLLGALLPSSFWIRFAYLFYGVCVVLLVAVMFKGTESHGSQRWISLGGFVLQPSEPMKLALILAMARYLSRHLPERGGYGILKLFGPMLLLGIPMGLIIRQPDLGTALSVGAVGFSMILFVGIRIRTLVYLALAIAACGYPIWQGLKPYQKARVMTLLNAGEDAKGGGYHMNQSKIAVGSGKLLGKGYMEGTQTQLEFLPEHTTDFVFAVLAEEWGFFGSFVVLTLYMLFIAKMMRLALRCRDLAHSLIIFGISVLVFFHCFVNIGMVIGILPIVGLPLPLFSYGGSALVSVMFSVGIVLGIGMRRFLFSSLPLGR